MSPATWPNWRSSGAVTAERHDLRAGAGIEGLHLDGGVVGFRQRGDRERGVSGESNDQDRDHQKCGCDRPKDEGARRIHVFARRHAFRTECLRHRHCRLRSLRSFLDFDLGAVLQFVKAGNRRRCRPALRPVDGRHVAVGGLLDDSSGWRQYCCNLVDKGLDAITLDGRAGNEQGVMQRAYQQTGIDELVGIEREIVVIELGAEADGAGSGINLIVDGEQMAGGELCSAASGRRRRR